MRVLMICGHKKIKGMYPERRVDQRLLLQISNVDTLGAKGGNKTSKGFMTATIQTRVRSGTYV